MTDTTQTAETNPTPLDQNRSDLQTAVATAYDLQKLRISTGNRLCANFRHKLGLQPSQPEEDLEDVTKEVIKHLRADYTKMTNGVMAITKADGSLEVPRSNKFKPGECITTYGEFLMFQQYLALEAQEADHFQKTIPSMLDYFPIYTHYLEHVKGVGPAMAAIIVRYFDIHKARHPTAFWAYAGLDVVVRYEQKDGEEVKIEEGRGMKKAHLVPRTYVRKGRGKGAPEETVETVGLSYHPFLKTKLMGVLAGSFLKCKSPYAELYYDYRNRLDNQQQHKDKTKGHKHAMALRFMIKQFLVDLHVNWCLLEGLPPSTSYQEGVLGKVHGSVHGGPKQRELLTHLVYSQDKKKAA
jgi:hypothetical protein